jgi:hypothetical protein
MVARLLAPAPLDYFPERSRTCCAYTANRTGSTVRRGPRAACTANLRRRTLASCSTGLETHATGGPSWPQPVVITAAGRPSWDGFYGCLSLKSTQLDVP